MQSQIKSSFCLSIGQILSLALFLSSFLYVRGHQKKMPYWPIKWVPFVRTFQNFVFELLKHPRTIPQNINFLDQKHFPHFRLFFPTNQRQFTTKIQVCLYAIEKIEILSRQSLSHLIRRLLQKTASL